MKKIETIIRPHLLGKLKEAFVTTGVQGMTVTEMLGYGRPRGQTAFYRGAKYRVESVNWLKIEIVIDEELLDEVLDAIIKTARTGHFGDGKIFISDIDSAIRIRTGEYNYNAI